MPVHNSTKESKKKCTEPYPTYILRSMHKVFMMFFPVTAPVVAARDRPPLPPARESPTASPSLSPRSAPDDSCEVDKKNAVITQDRVKGKNINRIH